MGLSAGDANLISKGVGAVVGAGSGAYAGYQQNKQNKRTLQAQLEENKALQELIDKQRTEGRGETTQAYGQQVAGYEGNLQDYLKQLQNTDYAQFNLEAPDEFQFDMNKATQEEMNPELQAIIDRSVQGELATGANQGSLFSGATGKNIAQVTEAEQAKEWDAARNRAQTQQQSKYQQYTDKWNQNKDIASANKANLGANIAGQGAAVGIQQSAWDKQRGELNAFDKAAADATMVNRQNQGTSTAQLKGLPSNTGATIQGLLGGLSSGLGGGK